MNEANRTAIVLLAAAWIVLMVVVIFLAWAAPGDAIEVLGDIVQEMESNNDTAGKLIVTLGALALAVFGVLVIILELAPEDEERELRVKQAGSTTIVPAQALRQRVEEAILALPEVTTVKARVWTQDNGIATNLDLGLIQRANIANVTQEASRLVVDIVQTELGLPVAGLPQVRIAFGGEKPKPVETATANQPYAASSVSQPPQEQPPFRSQEMPPASADEPSPFSRPPADAPPYSRPDVSDEPPSFPRPETPDKTPPPAEPDTVMDAPDEPSPPEYDPEPRRQDEETAGGSQP
jgi:hypothetical protein